MNCRSGGTSPPDANHLERMGVCVVVGERKCGRGVPGKSVIRPAGGVT